MRLNETFVEDDASAEDRLLKASRGSANLESEPGECVPADESRSPAHDSNPRRRPRPLPRSGEVDRIAHEVLTRVRQVKSATC